MEDQEAIQPYIIDDYEEHFSDGEYLSATEEEQPSDIIIKLLPQQLYTYSDNEEERGEAQNITLFNPAIEGEGFEADDPKIDIDNDLYADNNTSNNNDESPQNENSFFILVKTTSNISKSFLTGKITKFLMVGQNFHQRNSKKSLKKIEQAAAYFASISMYVKDVYYDFDVKDIKKIIKCHQTFTAARKEEKKKKRQEMKRKEEEEKRQQDIEKNYMLYNDDGIVKVPQQFGNVTVLDFGTFFPPCDDVPIFTSSSGKYIYPFGHKVQTNYLSMSNPTTLSEPMTYITTLESRFSAKRRQQRILCFNRRESDKR